MPEYLSPAVYVEEINSGARTIEGVSTSTVGFVGQTERGPITTRLCTSWLDYLRWFGAYIDPKFSYLPYAVKGFFDNGGQRAYIARVHRAGARATGLSIGKLRIDSIAAGSWGNRLFVRVGKAGQENGSERFRLTVLYYETLPPQPLIDPLDSANNTNPDRREPDAVEDYDNLGIDPQGANYALTSVNGSSQLVELSWISLPPEAPPNTLESSEQAALKNAEEQLEQHKKTLTTASDALQKAEQDADGSLQAAVDTAKEEVAKAEQALAEAQGKAYDRIGSDDTDDANAASDGSPASAASDYIGDPSKPSDQRTGLAGLEMIDDISLLCVPDHVHPALNGANQAELTQTIVNQCERLKDRFAILQTQAGQGSVSTIKPTTDTSYAALYYPWIRVYDPRLKDNLLVPPGGHVAGIIARTDIERGVHKAPANAVVRGIINRDLNDNRKPLEYQISKGEHDILNPRGINVIRDFRSDGRGIRLWGARTLSSDSAWKYVNVRRLFLFVEESIDEGTQFVVFEPNHEPTWAAVTRTITGFLRTVWRSGALQGVTEEEAFFVKCDRTTMTQDDIDNGRLICYIGIAPVKPAEFVIFRISQFTADASQN